MTDEEHLRAGLLRAKTSSWRVFKKVWGKAALRLLNISRQSIRVLLVFFT